MLETHDRQLHECQLLLREKEELAKLTQLLIDQTKAIGQYESGIRKRIQDCIKSSADQAVGHSSGPDDYVDWYKRGQNHNEWDYQALADVLKSLKWNF